MSLQYHSESVQSVQMIMEMSTVLSGYYQRSIVSVSVSREAELQPLNMIPANLGTTQSPERRCRLIKVSQSKISIPRYPEYNCVSFEQFLPFTVQPPDLLWSGAWAQLQLRNHSSEAGHCTAGGGPSLQYGVWFAGFIRIRSDLTISTHLRLVTVAH